MACLLPAVPSIGALSLSHELLSQTFGEFGVFLRFSAADADAADAAPGFVEYGHASGQRGEARIAEVRDGEVFPDEAIVERLRGPVSYTHLVRCETVFYKEQRFL